MKKTLAVLLALVMVFSCASAMAELTFTTGGTSGTYYAFDMPGLLVYTANGLETERGKNGRIYRKNYAICMETECFPNAVNLPNHRHQVFRPAKEKFCSCTEFQALLM